MRCSAASTVRAEPVRAKAFQRACSAGDVAAAIALVRVSRPRVNGLVTLDGWYDEPSCDGGGLLTYKCTVVRSPLQCAVHSGCVPLVHALVEEGAVLDMFVRHSNVRQLAGNADGSVADNAKSMITAVGTAILLKDRPMLAALHAAGADFGRALGLEKEQDYEDSSFIGSVDNGSFAGAANRFTCELSALQLALSADWLDASSMKCSMECIMHLFEEAGMDARMPCDF